MISRTERSSICAAGCYLPHLCPGKAGACLMQPRDYYPMFADLNGRLCVVVGGGAIAQRKVTTLLGYGARILLVSPTVTRRLASYVRKGRVAYKPRRFQACDLKGAWLVVASTDDEAVNRRVFEAAQRLRIFANVVDQKPLCSFIAPAILKRGALAVAVSTGGASPSLAKKLKRELDAVVGDRYGSMLKLLEGLRGIAKKRLPKYNDRKVYFDELVDGPVFKMAAAGKTKQARRRALHLLNERAKIKANGAC